MAKIAGMTDIDATPKDTPLQRYPSEVLSGTNSSQILRMSGEYEATLLKV
jgi:hypothetical protein